MKIAILSIVTALIGVQTYAVNFDSTFPNYKGGIDNCPATIILSNAIDRGGVNPINGADVERVYDCSDLGTDIPLNSKIKINGEFRMVDGELQDACQQGKKVNCYASNSGNGVCVVNPREQEQTTVYGDVGKRTEKFPRFDYIVSFSRGISKFQNSTGWTMDAKGCNSISATGYTSQNYYGSSGSGTIERKKCFEEMKNFMTGGFLYPNLSSPKNKRFKSDFEAPKDRYSDGVSIDPMWNKIDTLANCKLAYPDLINELSVKK